MSTTAAVALVNSTVTPVVDIVAPSNAVIAQSGWCGGTLDYTIMCTNGTEYQTVSGMISYAVANKNTATNAVNVIDDTSSKATAVTSGTLTVTWTITFNTATNTATIKATAVSSLTPSNFCLVYNCNPIIGNCNPI